jgi:hypothetical protein
MKRKILARRIKLLEAEVATLKAQVGSLRSSRFIVHDSPLYPLYTISCGTGVNGTLNVKGSGLASVSVRGINDENQ